MKKCSKCQETKNFLEFYNDKSKKDGVSSYCKICVTINVKKNSLNNKDKRKEYRKNYYKLNKEKIDKKNLEYYLKNREEQLLQRKIRWHSRKEENRIYRRKYKKERKQKDFNYKIRENLRNRLYYALKAKRWNKNSHFNEYIGCSQEELKKHLESQFKEGMTWENYGKWEIDHIIPLASSKTIEKIYQLSHYLNLQPLWKEEHRIKSNNDNKELRSA